MDETADHKLRAQAIWLLANHLLNCRGARWPGCDGLTLEEVVIAHYPSASERGLVPGLRELAAAHPALATSLSELFWS